MHHYLQIHIHVYDVHVHHIHVHVYDVHVYVDDVHVHVLSVYPCLVHQNFLCYDNEKNPFFLSVVGGDCVYRCILWRKTVNISEWMDGLMD